MFWVIEKQDTAILGYVNGRHSKSVLSGPHKTYDEAYEEKRNYRSFGSTYYTVEESDEKPAEFDDDYSFSDADTEFEDYNECYGSVWDHDY